MIEAAVLLLFLVTLVCFPTYYYFKNRKLESAFNKLSDRDKQAYLAKIDPLAEDNVRKKWLIAMLLNMSLGMLFIVLSLVGLSATRAMPLTGLFISLVVVLAIMGGGIAIAYHCAYKKRGTIYPVLSLIGVSYGMLSLLTGSDYSDPLMLTVALILFLPQVYYFWNSLKLYRVNAFRRSLKQLAVKERSLAVQA